MIVTKLGELLKARNIKPIELARWSGTRPNTVCDMCNGKSKTVKFSTLSAICQTLNCSVGDIIEYKK